VSVGSESTGTYSEYSLTDAKFVLPIHDSTSFENAANIFLNTFMVLYFMKLIKKRNHRAVVLNAAAGSISKNLIRYCNYLGIPTINIVNKNEQE